MCAEERCAQPKPVNSKAIGILGLFQQTPTAHVGFKQGCSLNDYSSSAMGQPCSNTRIESKSWRSGGGLSGEIGLKRSGLLRFRPRPSFETAVFAGSKSCPPRSSPVTAEPARSIGNHLIRVEPRKGYHLRHLPDDRVPSHSAL